jgi:hypothetical protein
MASANRPLTPTDLAETLAQRIRDGHYPPGTRLPSRARLAATFHAGLQKVTDALLLLQEQRLLEIEWGSARISAPLLTLTPDASENAPRPLLPMILTAACQNQPGRPHDPHSPVYSWWASSPPSPSLDRSRRPCSTTHCDATDPAPTGGTTGRRRPGLILALLPAQILAISGLASRSRGATLNVWPIHHERRISLCIASPNADPGHGSSALQPWRCSWLWPRCSSGPISPRPAPHPTGAGQHPLCTTAPS